MKLLVGLGILFSASLSFADFMAASLPLSSFAPGKLEARVLNKAKLEALAAAQGWLIDGVVYPHELDADAAVARRKIVCSFSIPSKELQSASYVLYLAEHYQVNAHHLEMIASNKFFGLTCFKNEKLSEMTLEELNTAFVGLLNWGAL